MAKEPSLYAGNFTGFQCASADINTFRFTVNQDANLLHVYAPRTTCFVVCVGNVVTCTRCFTCKKTFAGHDYTSFKSCVSKTDSISYGFVMREENFIRKRNNI